VKKPTDLQAYAMDKAMKHVYENTEPVLSYGFWMVYVEGVGRKRLTELLHIWKYIRDLDLPPDTQVNVYRIVESMEFIAGDF
jgi:hypothetical protein